MKKSHVIVMCLLIYFYFGYILWPFYLFEIIFFIFQFLLTIKRLSKKIL